MAMPAFTAWPGIGEFHYLAADPDLAFVSRMHAGDDLDQGGLAGAVFTQERMHLTRAHVEINMVEHFDADEGF